MVGDILRKPAVGQSGQAAISLRDCRRIHPILVQQPHHQPVNFLFGHARHEIIRHGIVVPEAQLFGHGMNATNMRLPIPSQSRAWCGMRTSFNPFFIRASTESLHARRMTEPPSVVHVGAVTHDDGGCPVGMGVEAAGTTPEHRLALARVIQVSVSAARAGLRRALR